MRKDFDDWNILKKKLDSKEKLPTFKQREVWWCHIGFNVGDEENGKNLNYHRPILIIKKFNQRIFLGLPLTTQIKESYYYHQIVFQDKIQCAMLSQVRILDSKRLDRRMGKVITEEFALLKRDLNSKIFK